jgi:hypothetical protein
MNELNYEQRLSEWSTFRDTLETSNDPLQDVIDYYRKIPTVSINTDPYTPSTWPSPWELVNDNMYCDFCRVLGMCYSLQLTDRFSREKFEIHIGIDNKRSEHYYLLVVGDRVLGSNSTAHVHVDQALKDLEPQQKHHMPHLN